MKNIVFVLALSLWSASAMAQTGTAPAKGEGPCKQLEDACTAAHFAPKTAGAGTGLWVDCMCPLLTGNGQPTTSKSGAKPLPLPTVDASVISACKTKRPQMLTKCETPKKK